MEIGPIAWARYNYLSIAEKQFSLYLLKQQQVFGDPGRLPLHHKIFEKRLCNDFTYSTITDIQDVLVGPYSADCFPTDSIR